MRYLNSLLSKSKKQCFSAIGTLRVMFFRSQIIVQDKSGEGFIDTAVKILISIVIGTLLLAGLYLLFADTILPTLTQRIQDMFNYQG